MTETKPKKPSKFKSKLVPEKTKSGIDNDITDFTLPEYKRSSYSKHLQEFEGKTVEVKDLFGEKLRGKCIAVNKSHLNVILETEEGTTIIKNIDSIRMDKE